MLKLRPPTPSEEEAVATLYLSSFPEEERIPFPVLKDMTSDSDCRLLVIDDGGFAGMAYVVSSPELIFLLYLAVEPDSRGCGVGSDVLWLLKNQCEGRRLFLNMEPVDEECGNISQRLRRSRFYERNGFRSCGSYRVPDGMRYTLMSWGGEVSPEEALAFFGSKMPGAASD